MCGIYGYITKSKNLFDAISINEVNASIRHRGPDDNGYFIYLDQLSNHLLLGQVRLSILDLSEAGHQPMKYANDDLVIVYNGEIYNFKEIKQKLLALNYSFRSNSDTEVLLASWQQWGPNCLKFLIGMFAFAIFDRKKNKIFIVRDAFGIKPLFFSFDKNKFCFASEVVTLLKFPGFEYGLDQEVAYDYLAYGSQNFGKRTFFSNIEQLMPSEYAEIDLNNELYDLKVTRWWIPSILENTDISFNQAADQLRELFLESIRYHLVSDVPVGVSLSGGIDSSSIACAVRLIEPEIDIHTFSYISSDNYKSEEKWIDLVNNRINGIPHKVEVRQSDILNDLDELIYTQGEPFVSTSMYAQYRVFDLVKKNGIKVVLEGQGADELLGGYDGYPGFVMFSLLESFEFKEMIQFSKKWKSYSNRNGRNAWLSLLNQLFPIKISNIINFYRTKSAKPWLKYHSQKVLLKELKEYDFQKNVHGRRLASVLRESLLLSGLQPLLRYGDRNAMHFSIENRVPFLTIPLADFVLSLPESFTVSKTGQTKSVFREAMRGIVPDLILDRKDKIGFETPLEDWVRNINNFQTEELEFLSSIKEFDSQYFRKHYDKPEPFVKDDWRLINLIKWANSYSRRK